MRTAIVHYWLLNMRGGERVLERLCHLLPDADLFTLFLDRDSISPVLRSRNIQTSFLNGMRSHYRSLLPLMPLALEQFDLREYDLVVSSESGPAKGVLTSSHTRHVCYCHTPMRYLWDLYPFYRKEIIRKRWKQAAAAPFAHYLRLWDYASAARVDEFVANSVNVQRRIWKTYRRDSQVVHPPVPVDTFRCEHSEGYYLMVSEFVAYKQLDYAIACFARSGRKLKVVGTGPEYGALKKLAGPATEFCGRVSEEELRGLYSRSRAFILPGEEDFGITPVEAQASGKAVIALGRGGALETVPSECGVFYRFPGQEALAGAIAEFESRESEFKPEMIQVAARRFSTETFDNCMRAIILAD
jgi:glycosyltransferase involved in cell wall biosynthesis